jgi:hypothetical protein
MSKKYRMTKRVRKSRQSRKRNIYVGGGGGLSAARNSNAQQSASKVEKSTNPADKAFDKINTPNITYWNGKTQSPFAVFTFMSRHDSSTRTIPGKWGHNTYYDPRPGAGNEVYKNFDMIYKNTPNIKGEKVRNTYSGLQYVTSFDIRPDNPYPEPPSGEVTNYTPYAADVTIGGVTYPKYNEAIHNPPQRTPGGGEGISDPLLESDA